MPRPMTPALDIRIIFVGVDGLGGADLRLEKEIAAIKDELTQDRLAASLPARADAQGTTDALHAALLDAPRAQVLHFSAHGHSAKGLMLRDADGHAVTANGPQLARFLGRFRNLRLIVLGACHQKQQADALIDVFDCVLATSGVVPIDASRQFMRALYKGLANGDSVAAAFETARDRLAIDAPGAEKQVCLMHRETIDPHWVRLDPVHGPTLTAAQRTATADYLRARVDSFRDVVLTANVKRWQDAVPHKPSAAPRIIRIEVPEPGDAWHRIWRPDRDEWHAVAAEIGRAVDEIRRGDWTRVHIVVHLPYSLAALLACALQAMNHELIIYQWTPPPLRAEGQRAWEPWGPGAVEAMPPRDDAPFFHPVDWPEHTMPDFTGDIAITVAVSRPIAAELVYAAAPDRSRIRLVSLVPRKGTGQATLDQHNIERAAGQLDEAIQMAGARFPNATAIHIFPCAPKALIMRGSLRVATSPVRVIVHEFFQDAEPHPLYLPMVDLKDGVVIEP